MFTRIKETLGRLNVGDAFRQSRQIAGAIAGSFFSLNGIFKVPLNQFFYGYGPAATTVSLAFVAFVNRLVGNYQASAPDSFVPILKNIESDASTNLIINMLSQDQGKARDFLAKYKIAPGDITRLENWDINHPQDLNDILDKLYNNIHFDIRKYPVSLILSLLIMGTHFMECMLLLVYVDPKMFDYNQVTPANVLLSLIMLLALYNGIVTFIEVKNSYEHPSRAALCDALFKAYDAHQVNGDVANRPAILPI